MAAREAHSARPNIVQFLLNAISRCGCARREIKGIRLVLIFGLLSTACEADSAQVCALERVPGRLVPTTDNRIAWSLEGSVLRQLSLGKPAGRCSRTVPLQGGTLRVAGQKAWIFGGHDVFMATECENPARVQPDDGFQFGEIAMLEAVSDNTMLFFGPSAPTPKNNKPPDLLYIYAGLRVKRVLYPYEDRLGPQHDAIEIKPEFIQRSTDSTIVWIAFQNTICRLELEKKRTETETADIQQGDEPKCERQDFDNSVVAMAPADADGPVWVGTKKGVVRWSGKAGDDLAKLEQFNIGPVASIASIDPDVAWALTTDGAFHRLHIGHSAATMEIRADVPDRLLKVRAFKDDILLLGSAGLHKCANCNIGSEDVRLFEIAHGSFEDVHEVEKGTFWLSGPTSSALCRLVGLPPWWRRAGAAFVILPVAGILALLAFRFWPQRGTQTGPRAPIPYVSETKKDHAVTLIRDYRQTLAPGPKVHVFIAGVSEYVYLPAAGKHASSATFGLRKLTSAARSAFEFFQWVDENRNNLVAPVATIRLLLSPSQTELGAEPAMRQLNVNRCTRAEFERAYREWRAVLQPGDLALFYFSGHGAHRSRRDGLLLFEDFNPDRNGNILAGAAEVNNLIDALAPSPSQRQTASRQVFFIDSCRVEPKEFSQFEKLRAPDVVTITRRQNAPPDEREFAVLYAAMPGENAYAVPGQQSLFCRALLRCLENDGATPSDHEDELGHVPWMITTESIHT